MSQWRYWQSMSLLLMFGCTLVDDAGSDDARGELGQDNVTFYGIGKVARYKQHADSSLEMLGPLFFAEIFIAEGGEVTDAEILFPPPVGTVRQLQYEYSESNEIGDVMYISGKADTNEELDRSFPSGAYRFSFETPGGSIVDSVVSFEGGHFPRQPVIVFKQNGIVIDFDNVDPNNDLLVTWPPFDEGSADENGVLDDLIFVAIDSCTVEDMVHSGRPFEKDDYLTFRASEYTVPAGTFAPGQTYSMYLEHALLPHTQTDYGMPAFATFAASTYMDFQTTGETAVEYCAAAN